MQNIFKAMIKALKKTSQKAFQSDKLLNLLMSTIDY